VFLSSHPDIATFPVPKGKYVGVDFFGRGHPRVLLLGDNYSKVSRPSKWGSTVILRSSNSAGRSVEMGQEPPRHLTAIAAEVPPIAAAPDGHRLVF